MGTVNKNLMKAFLNYKLSTIHSSDCDARFQLLHLLLLLGNISFLNYYSLKLLCLFFIIFANKFGITVGQLIKQTEVTCDNPEINVFFICETEPLIVDSFKYLRLCLYDFIKLLYNKSSTTQVCSSISLRRALIQFESRSQI